MRPTELAQRLASDAEGVCRKLLPGGKRHGNEWRCGDLTGKPGNSLGVRVAGDKAGVWSDFAAGSSGDMIGLIMAATGKDLRAACDWAREYLGIRDERPFVALPKARPVAPITAPAGSPAAPANVETWLRKRKLPAEVLTRYKVSFTGTTINLPYYRGDEVVFCKHKDIAKPRKESWRCTPGGSPILFGWQAIPVNAREVVITEGEWDALAYAAAGIPALSVPAGAGVGEKLRWIELDWDQLERFDTLLLSFDADDAGRSMLPHVIERLGHYRCRVVELPAGCKDSNEALVAGHDLKAAVAAARYCDPPELRSMESFAEDVKKLFLDSSDQSRGDRLPWSEMDPRFRMRNGELTIWHGYSGHGKTMLLSHVCASLICRGKKVCIASMEMPAAKLLRRMYQQIAGQEALKGSMIDTITNAVRGRGWLVDIRGTTKAELILRLLDYAHRRYGVEHFVVDSLAKCGFAEDDYNGQKGFVDALTDYVRDRPLHIHLVCHDRKDNHDLYRPNKMDVKGTGGITDMADNVVAVWRNRPKEDARAQGSEGKHASEGDAYIEVQKQRHHDYEGRTGLWYHCGCHQYRGAPAMHIVSMLELAPSPASALEPPPALPPALVAPAVPEPVDPEPPLPFEDDGEQRVMGDA